MGSINSQQPARIASDNMNLLLKCAVLSVLVLQIATLDEKPSLNDIVPEHDADGMGEFDQVAPPLPDVDQIELAQKKTTTKTKPAPKKTTTKTSAKTKPAAKKHTENLAQFGAIRRAARIAICSTNFCKSVPVAQSPLKQYQCTARTHGQRNMDCCCSNGRRFCGGSSSFGNCCEWIKQQWENNCNFNYELYRRHSRCPRGQDPLSPLKWKKCAKEGDHCSFKGSAFVRYGALVKRGGTTTSYFSPRRGGNDIIKTNGVSCTNAEFGDPIVGTVKSCYIHC